MKRIYEILDECKLCETIPGILQTLARNDSPTLREVLKHAYHPNAKWYISDWPTGYKKPDTLPGMSQTNLYTEIRRLYLFQVGHPTADAMTPAKRNNLLNQILEGMEPDEAQVVIDIFKGDLQIDGLNVETINQLYPGLIV